MQYKKRSLNRESMQQVLDNFVELTGIRAAYFENHIELINGKNKEMCSFCRLVRELPQLDEGCKKSDLSAVNAAEESGKPYIYTCHMGFWETVIPVSVRNIPAGYLMLGQVRNNDADDRQWPEISNKLTGMNVPIGRIEEMKTAFDGTLGMDAGKVRAAANMLHIIAKYIIDADVIRVYDLDAVEKAKKFINDHFKKDISSKTIAGITGLSPSYFGFVFRKETGCTLTSYLETCRCGYAKELLESTSLSIKEIASDTGYADQNYFSRMFKKHEGTSPSEYRQNCRKVDAFHPASNSALKTWTKSIYL